jgi:Leucine-rich repeat (LRR) protein
MVEDVDISGRGEYSRQTVKRILETYYDDFLVQYDDGAYFIIELDKHDGLFVQGTGTADGVLLEAVGPEFVIDMTEDLENTLINGGWSKPGPPPNFWFETEASFLKTEEGLTFVMQTLDTYNEHLLEGLASNLDWVIRRGGEVPYKMPELNPDDIEVFFPDEQLETAVRNNLKIWWGPIGREALNRLEQLMPRGEGITDLTGIEHAVNLKQLSANQNQISDVSPLASLDNLKFLNLSGNQISDVGPLASRINLSTLWLGRNQITNVSPLASLTNLRGLWLPGNQITDVSPLASLTNLKFLNLSDIQISDVGPLASLTKLTELYLSVNGIKDVGPLASLTKLTELTLNGNQISDVGPLASLTKLIRLNLGGNPLSQESVDVHVPNLKARGVRVTGW